jgi:amidase
MKKSMNRRNFLEKASLLASLTSLSPLMTNCNNGNIEIPSDVQIPFLSASEMALLIRNKKISSVEITQLMLSRIAAFDQKINAINVLLKEEAIKKAGEADEALSRGAVMGPLHGVPMTIKDSFRIKGVITTAGNPALRNYIPEEDASAVARLRNAGAIFLGNTNVPYMLDDHQSFNEVYGRTRNPYNLERSPGGSTGGGAAALAAGFSYLSLGSDTAGSIRIPSHFCGVFGHKPTIDLVPKKGQIPPLPGSLPYKSNGLSVAGPLARSAEDLGLLLEICGGPVEPDSIGYSWKMPGIRKKDLKDFRIKFVVDDPLCPVSSEIKPVIDEAIQSFSREGIMLEEGWPSTINPEEQFLNYVYLLQAYISGGATDKEIERLRIQAQSAGNDLEKVRAHAYSDPHKYFKIQESMRLKARENWQQYFRDYDAFILPVAFMPAFPHIEKPWLLHNPDPASKRILKTPEGDRDYDDIIFWISFATLTGLPATVFPIGLTQTGLPVGLQVIGPFLEDATPIFLAGKLAEITGGIRHPEGFV